MVKVELTPGQAEELRNHYINELERLQKKSIEILGLLKAMGQSSEDKDDESNSLIPATQVAGVAQTPTEKPAAKFQGKKPSWSSFVVSYLTETQKPTTREEIFNAYNDRYGIDEEKYTSAKNSLSQSLHWLGTKKEMIESKPRPGKRGHFYVLKNQAAE